MNIEDNIFKKSVVNFDKLLKYGFKKVDNKYLYSKTILDNTFKVVIELDSTKKVRGKMIIIPLKFTLNKKNIKIC